MLNAVATAIPGYNSVKRVAHAVAQLVTEPMNSPNVAAAVRKGLANTAQVCIFISTTVHKVGMHLTWQVTAVESLNLLATLMTGVRMSLEVAQGLSHIQ